MQDVESHSEEESDELIGAVLAGRTACLAIVVINLTVLTFTGDLLFLMTLPGFLLAASLVLITGAAAGFQRFRRSAPILAHLGLLGIVLAWISGLLPTMVVLPGVLLLYPLLRAQRALRTITKRQVARE